MYVYVLLPISVFLFFVEPPTIRIGVVPSDYTDSMNHVYENLPQQKSPSPADTDVRKPWQPAVEPEVSNPSGPQRRRSNLYLMTPKPFSLNSKPTPFTSVFTSSSTANFSSPNLDQPDAAIHNQNTLLTQSQPILHNSKIESNKSNVAYEPTEPLAAKITNKTPPPPPVRDSSRFRTSEVNPKAIEEMFAKSSTSRNFEPPVPAILKKGKNNRALNKTRYMTISSSEPVKLEKSSPQSPKLHSQAGDLITSVSCPYLTSYPYVVLIQCC